MFSLCFRMCQIALCSVCVSECVGSLSMFSLCFRMCQIAFSVQFVFHVSECSECVGSLLIFSLCF